MNNDKITTESKRRNHEIKKHKERNQAREEERKANIKCIQTKIERGTKKVIAIARNIIKARTAKEPYIHKQKGRHSEHLHQQRNRTSDGRTNNDNTCPQSKNNNKKKKRTNT